MAIFEGPAPSGGELLGVPTASPMTDQRAAEPVAPKLTSERAKQELTRLRAIIRDNASLHFLEPRVVKCAESETQDSATFLSFYRLISQSLSEELVHQKERLQSLEGEVVRAKQSTVQNQMDLALAEASQAVNRVSSGDSAPTSSGSSDSFAHSSDQAEILLAKLAQAEVQRERLLVDMQNMRNRSKTDIDVKVFKAVEKFTLSLLPALDAFHQAMPSLKTATDVASITTGIEMIHDQLHSALAQAGLKRMDVLGVLFDPHLHESIGDVETWDLPDEHIYDELQPGYLFGERLIRAAIVRLARNTGTPPAPTPAVAAPVAAPISPPPAAPAPIEPETVTPQVTDSPAPAVSETTIPEVAEVPEPQVTEAPAPAVPATTVPEVAETPEPQVTEAPAVSETTVPEVTEAPLPEVGQTPVLEASSQPPVPEAPPVPAPAPTVEPPVSNLLETPIPGTAEPAEQAPRVIQITLTESPQEPVAEVSAASEPPETASTEIANLASSEDPVAAPSGLPTIVDSNPFLPVTIEKPEAEAAPELSGIPEQASTGSVIAPEASLDPTTTEASTPLQDPIAERAPTPPAPVPQAEEATGRDQEVSNSSQAPPNEVVENPSPTIEHPPSDS